MQPGSFRIALQVCAAAAAVCVAASPTQAATLNVPAPLGPQQSLDAFWPGPTGPVTTIQIPAARAVAARTAGIASQPNPFTARAAALDAIRQPDAAAQLRTDWRQVGPRFKSARGLARASSSSRPGHSRHAAATILAARMSDLRIAWDRDLPIFMTGSDLGSTGKTTAGAENVAAAFWSQTAPLFGIDDPASELRLVRSEIDALGQTHLRYEQLYNGIPVWGREAIVHVQADGRVDCFSGRLAPTPMGLRDSAARLGAAAAEHAAASAAGAPGAATTAEDMQIWIDAQGMPALVWRVQVATALDRIHDAFVDATTGSLVHRISRVATDGPVAGSGIDLQGQSRALALYQVGANYFNINTSKPMFVPGSSNIPQDVTGGIRVFTAQHSEGDPLVFSVSTNPTNWSGKAGQVSAAANAAIVYDYYNQRHTRNSIDGNGGTMEVVVDFKSNFNNAFWNGQFMVFGNGDGTTFSDLAAALDVTAHEMTHGVVEHTANLVYETQSGALNESFADVFGACAEWYARPSTGNWLLGEEITTPSIANDALRNMQDPGASNVAFNGQQPTHMSEYENLANDAAHDNGGVHVNSGIPNRAFYLVATNPALGGTNGDRIGKAERIYYRALSTYLTRTSQFIDCRLAVIRAATDLYGGPVAAACGTAFDTVGIVDGDPTEPPPTLPPVEGTDYFGITQASNGQLLRATTDLAQVIPLSSVAISNKPTYTDDGQFVIFIDAQHKLRFARTDGTGEAFLSEAPVWRSIAVSPDGNSLAATSTALDDSLYVLDLSGTGQDRAYAIETPNYGGEGDDPAQYADFLDFSNDGQFVLFDVFNRKQSGSGTIEYWDIEVLRAEDGAIQRVFPPQPAGINIGNPTFSPRSDFIIALDYQDEEGNVSVLGADLEQGNVGLITNNFASTGRPSFSPDATQVVYHYIENQTVQLWVVSLESDGITGAGDDASIANGGFDPVWFAIGARPAVVLTGLAAERTETTVHIRWEARPDAVHEYFLVLRDAGAGFEPRSGALREPVDWQSGTGTWEFVDDLTDLPEGIDAVRYAIQAVDRAGEAVIAGVLELRLDSATAPPMVRLMGNVPNPFNPSTAIQFAVDRPQPVRLDVYDAAGRRVRSLWSGIAAAGSQLRVWDGRDDAGQAVASGIYVARLVAEDGTRSRKMTLLK